MGAILTALTVLLALARTSFVRGLRRVSAHIQRLSALLLGLAGAYVAYYGLHTLKIYNGNLDAGGPAAWGTNFSAWMSDRMIEMGTIRLGLLSALLVSTCVLLALWRTGRRQAQQEEPTPSTSSEDSKRGGH